ncbi:MAG TPA: alpha/beta hydrolase [Chloroflexota bacterium]|nr:alpha/beta hydrolase [Chloroflexota bacterium]
MSATFQATGQVAGGQERKTARQAVAGTPALRSRIWRRALGVALTAVKSTVKWVALALLAALAAVPVAVSLRWGPTPRAAALLLAAAWAALLVLLVLGAVRRRSAWAQLTAALGLVLLVPVTVVLSQATAYTPPITDAQGKVVPGSIATLEQVTLGGSEQWISIRGRRTDDPVLLWLSGGPGGSQLATARHHLRGLEERFVVVVWEQPGAGKSYHAVPHATLTPERYVADGHELVQYLRRRFGQEKVYLVGESWGSALGIWLVQRHPELFHAFAGTGQMVAFLETDRLDYEFALRLARERGDAAKVAALERQGPPPYYGEGVAWKQAAYLLDGFAYMNADPAIAADGFDTVQDLLSPEYGLYDKANWARGVLDTLDVGYPQLWAVDLRAQAPRLEVPVAFLIGRHDVNAPPALAEEYYRLLEAPRKEWVWFERSGHNPWVSESERFVAVVAGTFLGEAASTRR